MIMDTTQSSSGTTPGSQSGAAVGQPAAAPRVPAEPAFASRIQHPKPGIGPGIGSGLGTGIGRTGGSGVEVARPPDQARPVPMAEGAGMPGMPGKITAFGKDRRHEESWCRTPNTTGQGAIHVKTFHCKLTEDALT